jgi:hypothetical protein
LRPALRGGCDSADDPTALRSRVGTSYRPRSAPGTTITVSSVRSPRSVRPERTTLASRLGERREEVGCRSTATGSVRLGGGHEVRAGSNRAGAFFGLFVRQVARSNS